MKILGTIFLLLLAAPIGIIAALWVAERYIQSHTPPVQSQSIVVPENSTLSVVQPPGDVLSGDSNIQPASGFNALTEPQNGPTQ